MKCYRVWFWDDGEEFAYLLDAESEDHAREQFFDVEPGMTIKKLECLDDEVES